MKPNFIIIISDALRPKDMSLYGREKVCDPFLRRFAEECVVFENNFAASNGSDPSVTSLFSGQYPNTSGFIHQHPFMRKNEIDKLKKNKFWLPLYLQEKGYETISATPLHLWFKKGFDSYTDKDSLKTGRFLDKPVIKRALLALPNWAYALGKKLTKVRASPEFYSCEKVMDNAMSKVSSAKKPFFLFMHMVDTHYPYAIAKMKDIQGKEDLNSVTNKIKYPKQREYIKKRFFDLNARNMEQIEQKRDDSILAVDKQIERFIGFLNKSGLLKNTFIAILSDHGDNFGEHDNYFCRGGLYDESVHVPLIIRAPGLKPGRVGGITQTIDLPATILKILKEKKYKIDGKSLTKLAGGNKTRDYAFFMDAFCDSRAGIRTEHEKLILNGNGECYLCGARHCISDKESYILDEDRGEANNVYHPNGKAEKEIGKFLKGTGKI